MGTHRPRGQPSKLDQIIRPPLPAQGTPGTDDFVPARPARSVAEVVIEQAATGATIHECAAAAGVARATIYLWIDQANEGNRRRIAGEKLTAHQRRAIEFLDAFEAAQALANLTDRAVHAKLSRDGWEGRTVTRRLRAGVEVERIETTTQRPPSLRGLEYRIGLREPRRVEISGPDGGPIEVQPVMPREELLSKLARLQQERDELARVRKRRAIETGEAG